VFSVEQEKSINCRLVLGILKYKKKLIKASKDAEINSA
jgi:hypothetical protein